MTPPPEPRYRLVVTEPALNDLAEARARAAARGDVPTVRGALLQAVRLLKTAPAAFGDPLYRTRRAGGEVHHALRFPLLFRYALFEDEKVVFLFHVRLL